MADEEALGTHGADWLTRHEADALRADYVVTEPGSVPIIGDHGIALPVAVAEKGSYWCQLAIRGTAGHASQPLRTDNALVTAAAVVQRLAAYRPAAVIHDAWRRFVQGAGFEEGIAAALLDPSAVADLCEALPLSFARQAHACTHTTFAPTVVHGGVKTNVIPDLVTLEVDIRTLPGQSGSDVRRMLDDLLGDLAGRVEIHHAVDDPPTASAIDTPLWDALAKTSGRLVPGGKIIPTMTVGATDARFFRRLGATCYGFGLFSARMEFERYLSMFHGDNERVDTESLALSTELWIALAQEFLD